MADGDFLAQGNPKELPLVTTVLSNPKISFYPGYVAEGKHYNQDDFQLRGYEQYWLKKDVDPASTNKEKVAVHLRPLPAGTRFAGVIRYKNLRPEELGLLLWSIRLEEGCYQSVGMGKPYGYGRMKVSIDELREFDLAAMYCPENLCVTPPAASPDAIQEYIDVYDAADFRKEAEEAAQAAAAAAKAPASEDDYSLEAMAEGVTLREFRLRDAAYWLKGRPISGFRGTLVLENRLSGFHRELTDALLVFSGFSGVGIKTTLGMGGVRHKSI